MTVEAGPSGPDAGDSYLRKWCGCCHLVGGRGWPGGRLTGGSRGFGCGGRGFGIKRSAASNVTLAHAVVGTHWDGTFQRIEGFLRLFAAHHF